MTMKATKSITDITITAQAEGTNRLSEVNDDGGRTWSKGDIVPASEERERDTDVRSQTEQHLHDSQVKDKSCLVVSRCTFFPLLTSIIG